MANYTVSALCCCCLGICALVCSVVGVALTNSPSYAHCTAAFEQWVWITSFVGLAVSVFILVYGCAILCVRNEDRCVMIFIGLTAAFTAGFSVWYGIGARRATGGWNCAAVGRLGIAYLVLDGLFLLVGSVAVVWMLYGCYWWLHEKEQDRRRRMIRAPAPAPAVPVA